LQLIAVSEKRALFVVELPRERERARESAENDEGQRKGGRRTSFRVSGQSSELTFKISKTSIDMLPRGGVETE
jgi:hypothetical protein